MEQETKYWRDKWLEQVKRTNYLREELELLQLRFKAGKRRERRRTINQRKISVRNQKILSDRRSK